MQEHDLSYVRMEMLNAQAAPSSEQGVGNWVRRNLFPTPLDTVLTILAMLIMAWFLPPLLRWLFIDAQWTGEAREV